MQPARANRSRRNTSRRKARIGLPFWTAVRDATGPKPDCADRKLEKWLWTTVLKRTTTERVIVGTREMYVKCIHAWNAWRKNEATNLAYFAKAKTPAAA